jgi:hypothetical protein
VLAGIDGRERVGDAGARRAGGVDHDLHVLRLAGGAAFVDEARRGDARLVPADAAARRPGALRIEVGDDRHLKARNGRHLRQEHGAELARPDERGAHRAAHFHASAKEGGEVHGNL